MNALCFPVCFVCAFQVFSQAACLSFCGAGALAVGVETVGLSVEPGDGAAADACVRVRAAMASPMTMGLRMAGSLVRRRRPLSRGLVLLVARQACSAPTLALQFCKAVSLRTRGGCAGGLKFVQQLSRKLDFGRGLKASPS